MIVTFFSNFINHHQIPFCDEMFRILGNNFCFVQTQPQSEERLKLGWKEDDNLPYLLKTYTRTHLFIKALQLGKESDVVIFGSAPRIFIKERKNKATFIYSERFFKKGFQSIMNPFVLKNVILNHTFKRNNQHYYLLCSGAFVPYDASRIFAYPGRMFKWGYFPEPNAHDLSEILKFKNHYITTILWAGRFIKWKHPEYALLLAKKLKEENIRFILKIIGTGDEGPKLKKMQSDWNLTNEVEFLGSMIPEKVRDYMEKSDIFIFTSDYYEGWGAVLNEAMNSGCAVVASHAIGSVPYLIENDKNGYIYKNGDFSDFYLKVTQLIKYPEKRILFGESAYNTIQKTWNPKMAAERIINVSESVLKKETIDIFASGPCSKAETIKNNWL